MSEQEPLTLAEFKQEMDELWEAAGTRTMSEPLTLERFERAIWDHVMHSGFPTVRVNRHTYRQLSREIDTIRWRDMPQHLFANVTVEVDPSLLDDEAEIRPEFRS